MGGSGSISFFEVFVGSSPLLDSAKASIRAAVLYTSSSESISSGETSSPGLK